MTEVEFSKLLADLSTSAIVLNRSSDSINEIISRLQETLRSMNIGIEVWVGDDLSSRPWSEEEGERRGTNDQKLGFAKVGSDWCLAVRQEVWQRDESDWELIDRMEPERLLETSRSLRLKALEMFPGLVRQLKAEADAAVRAVENAKKFVNK